MWRWAWWLMRRRVETALCSSENGSMGRGVRDGKWGCRHRGIRRGGTGSGPRTFRGGAVGAIVTGGALPGCRTRLRHLLPVARVGLLMYCGRVVLSAVRALHRRGSNTRHAEHAEGQHHSASDPADSDSDRRAHPTSHRGSIADPWLPRNAEFRTSGATFPDAENKDPPVSYRSKLHSKVHLHRSRRCMRNSHSSILQCSASWGAPKMFVFLL